MQVWRARCVHLLSIYKPTAESKYGLTRIGIFGSVARGEQTEDTDVVFRTVQEDVPQMKDVIDRMIGDVEGMYVNA
jgi:predicted nucleotidyltransferase